MIKTFLGLRLGSTRIKAVLIDEAHAIVEQKSYAWEDRLENGVWTYALAEVWQGLRTVVESLLQSLQEPVSIESIGISGIMHGYMPFDEQGNLLTAYRTGRNTFTGKASLELTALFGRNIPQRWSISHLYHAVCAEEAYVRDIRRVCTLAGYVHYRLSGEFVTGIGEATGMFPLDGEQYDRKCVEQFTELVSDYRVPWSLEAILPGIRVAGEYAGVLTEKGARLLDSTGKLKAGTPMAPPEGDAGIGMVSTNSVAPHTGTVSAGASISAMTVLEKPLSRAYPEIDIVATPTGKPVAMVHCNNCIPDINAWLKTYQECCTLAGAKLDADSLQQMLFQESLRGDPDCGGITVIGYLAGEQVTDFNTGYPLVLRDPAGRFTLANFLRAQLYASLASFAIGMRILARENVTIDRLMANGGLLRVPKVGQQYLADAVNAPVAVMEAGDKGGAYGMALLAAFHVEHVPGETLENYLEQQVFATAKRSVLLPDPQGVQGFRTYLQRFEKALKVERTATDCNLFGK